MITILFMVSVSLILAGFFVAACLWAIGTGQFDDVETPSMRLLKEDQIKKGTRNDK